SKIDGSIRLYNDLTLHSYLEIPRDAILSTIPQDTDDELSPTIVRVKPGTLLEVVYSTIKPVESFHEGGITARHLGRAGVAVTSAPWAKHLLGKVDLLKESEEALIVSESDIERHTPEAMPGRPIVAAITGAICITPFWPC